MNKPKGLKKSTRNNTIRLDGMIGEFHSPHSSYTTKFFSTAASSRLGKPYETFLKELKPMRERMNPEDITSMEQVLQRDLDDYRVSKGLIPYLINSQKQIDHVAFFPSILAVLMPKDYIRDIGKTGSKYPKGSTTENTEERTSEYYGKNNENETVLMWTVSQWKIDDNEMSPLGQLVINLDEAEIVVIDGQHRANAFRVVTNSFFNNSHDNSPYKIFYSDFNIKDFHADLPVTVIWFEKNQPLNNEELKHRNQNIKSEIQPEIVTRRIFIDVNNSARKVNFNRELLMNDREPSSYLTSCFYSKVASEFGFKFLDNLSLGHLGFDLPVSLADSPNLSCSTISCPEIIHAIIDWTYFSSGYYANQLSAYEVKRDKKRDNLTTFSKYFNKSPNHVTIEEDLSSERGNIIKRIKDTDHETLETIEAEFNTLCFPVIYNLFNRFKLVKSLIETTREYEERIKKKPSIDFKHIWENVYKGGEGLFYTYSLFSKDPNKINDDSIKIVATIEQEFKNLRFELIKEKTGNSQIKKETVNSAFKTFTTFAFQIAYINSFYSFCTIVMKYNGVDYYKPEKLSKALDLFINRINSKGIHYWITFLTEFKSTTIGELTPKLWPFVHKLILRSIQIPNEIFSANNLSPEQYIFESKYTKALRDFLRNNYGKEKINKMSVDYLINNHDSELKNFQNSITSEVKNSFSKMNLEIIAYDIESVISRIHSEEVGKHLK